MKSLLFFGIAFIILQAFSAQAQTSDYTRGYETDAAYSLRPVHESHIAYKKTLWYRVQLREKQNRPFFSRGNEISKILIDATKIGIIRPFMSDSLATRMPMDEFLERLKIPSEDAAIDEDMMMFTAEDDSFSEFGETETGISVAAPQEYFPNQLDLLQIKEHLIFDKKTGKMKHDIQSVALIIPAKAMPTGIEKTLAVFSYKELVQNLFLDNQEAFWYNEQNERMHINLADAFELRLFSSTLTKYGNGSDLFFADMHKSERQALIESTRYVAAQAEYESHLWEN